MSLVEAIANVAVGFAVALLTQIIVFPLFDVEVTIGENLAIGSLFTGASICRSFALRRVFEAIRVRGFRSITAGHGARRHWPWRWFYGAFSCKSRRLKSSGAVMLAVTVLPKRRAPALPTK
jgi:hypothetical protein